MAAGIENSNQFRRGGPPVVAPPMWTNSGNAGQPLTDEELAVLATNATIVRFRRGETIFEEGDQVSFIYSIVEGLVKLYRRQPSGKEHIVRFMFQNDLIGLAEHGRYVNSAKSVTATILFKIPTQTLEARLRQSPGLEFHIIMKLCHELRRTQDRALLLSKHHTSAKIGLFVQMLEAEQQARGENTTELYLPMTRTDIGAYVGISPEAVSRGFAELAGCGVIAFKDRRHLIVVDRAKLTAAIAETSRPGSVAGARRRRTREPA